MDIIFWGLEVLIMLMLLIDVVGFRDDVIWCDESLGEIGCGVVDIFIGLVEYLVVGFNVSINGYLFVFDIVFFLGVVFCLFLDGDVVFELVVLLGFEVLFLFNGLDVFCLVVGWCVILVVGYLFWLFVEDEFEFFFLFEMGLLFLLEDVCLLYLLLFILEFGKDVNFELLELYVN